jgi:phage terminase large subunit-like protein
MASEYAESVLNGAAGAGTLVRLTVERQQRDLAAIGSPGFPYVFDVQVGAKVVRFLELLPHVEGPKAGEPVQLEPWQVWTVLVLYGWLRSDTGYPRFRRGTLFMPKGNGKTFLAAGLALHTLATGGKGEKVFSAATAMKQARQSFDTARQMLLRSPDLRAHFGLSVEQHAITQVATGGAYRPLSSDADSLEGIIPSFILEDEIHAHPTRDVHDNLRSSAAKRPDSRQIIISTAGLDLEGIGHEVYDYARDILTGRVKDPSQFALLVEADEGADPFCEATWRQANPNYGVSIDAVEIENEAREAQQRSSKRRSFFTKRLGWWVDGAREWMKITAWNACADPNLQPQQFKDDPCFVGLDLASKVDIAAKALLFVRDQPATSRDEQGNQRLERHYYLFVECYLNEARVEDGSNASYPGWAADGWLHVTPGTVTDFGVIKQGILNDGSKYEVQAVGVDPFNATQLTQELIAEGIQVVEVPQKTMHLSEPMKELEAAVLSGRFHHNANPVMAWMISNVMVKEDANGNLFPNKKRSKGKIDGVSATLNALNRALNTKIATSRPRVWNLEDENEEGNKERVIELRPRRAWSIDDE